MKRFHIRTEDKEYEFEALDIIDLVCYVLPKDILQDLWLIEVI